MGWGISPAANGAAAACGAGGTGTSSLLKVDFAPSFGESKRFLARTKDKGTQQGKANVGRVSLKDGVSKICLSEAGDVFLSRSVQ